jgi:serine/threonine protein kinase
MIHQDLRPANIMIDQSGSVKIIDLGSVRVAGITEINTFMEQENLLGTAAYSAPEYFLGDVGTYRSDLFSLGVIVYQMLSGKLPYGTKIAKSRTGAEQRKLIYRSLCLEDRDMPFWIDETLKKALSVNPNKRYQELSEFIYDLRHPNQTFLNKAKEHYYEQNPIIFWKGLSFVLFTIILLLLFIQR